MQISLHNFAFFTVKSPSVTKRSVSQGKAFNKSKTPSPSFRKTIGSNNSFTLIENNFSVFCLFVCFVFVFVCLFFVFIFVFIFYFIFYESEV